ncbi:MAG TPA: YraN family protein [Candidatus Cloacimonadota bacterium]|nr:YraN family protein [Candidatus Cloacimonadota bacterium]
MKNYERAARGKFGEDMAANFLLTNRYKILHRNFHSRFGEIDIIAFFDHTVIFVEVKLRKNDIDNALNSVSRAKQNKLVKTANAYLEKHPELEDYSTRFDIVAIIQKGEQYQLQHFQDAFLPRENQFSTD